MKQFSLEEFKKSPNRKVVTRDGRSARILCTDAERRHPIVALINDGDGNDLIECYNTDGTVGYGDSGRDLFLDVENKEGYVNLYRSKLFSGMCQSSLFVLSKEDAEKEAAKYQDDFIATAKVTWEE